MKQMTSQEIVEHSDEVKESGYDWKKAYASIFASIQSNQYRVMRCGNTLFWYKLLPNKTAQMFIFNADDHKHFLRNTKEFIKAMKAAGFKTIFGDTENIQIINMLKKIVNKTDIQDAGVDEKGRKLYRGVLHV